MLSASQLEVLRSEFVSNSWVNPFAGFNRGYRLEPSFARAARSGARLFDLSIKLPTASDMSVYMMPIKSVSWIGSIAILRKWINLTDYCNQTGTLLTVINPITGKSLNPSDCYICMINGIYPVLTTPYTGGAVDVNVFTSVAPNAMSIYPFELTGEIGEVVSDEVAATMAGGLVYIDGVYHNIDDASKVPNPSTGWVVYNPNNHYVCRSKVSALSTYQDNGSTFFIIDLGLSKDLIYHYIDMELNIYNSSNNKGVVIDKTAWEVNLVQLSNSAIGLRAGYIENLCDLADIPIELATISIYAPISTKVYLDNAGYCKTLNNLDATTQTAIMANGDDRLKFLYGATLAHNANNALQCVNIPNTTLTADNFEQHVIDNRLMTKRSDVVDERLSKYMLSGTECNKYKNKLGYTATTANLSSYVFPRIFKRDHTPGEFGVDYYVSSDGVITLLNNCYLIDYNGRYEISVDRPFEVIELSALGFYDHPEVVVEVMADGVLLHPRIDYGILPEGIIVWKEGVSTVDIALYFSNYHKSTTGWVIDGELVIPKTYIYGMAPRINVFVGEELIEPEHKMQVKNGVPYTITYELLSAVDSNTDLIQLVADRAEYDANIDTLVDYYTRADTDYPVTGFTDFYHLVSPLCIDVLAALKSGEIDPSMDNIRANGVEGCIPQSIMDKFEAGYDPASDIANVNSNFVIFKAHDEPDLVEITPDQWNFMRQVSSILLGGKITLELYYRIVYE